MKILILGWYGTETIGDRAILAGLYSLINKTTNNFEIYLGSLNPFFTKRTLEEDTSLYQRILNKTISITLFDSKNIKTLEKYIQLTDYTVMGGGPLMDLNELHMINYAFKFSKIKNKKTALLGCGIGPLFHNEFQRIVIEICDNSDLIILRDKKSKKNLLDLYNNFKIILSIPKIIVSMDPSFEILHEKNINTTPKDYIAINLRDFPKEYLKNGDKENINNKIKSFIKRTAIKYKDYEIRLIPMHYFHIGNDDRSFLNMIALTLNSTNITVQNKNLTLEETLSVYKNAYLNVGMRYHSVVIQTLISGKNYVLDYTEPNKGKINGFLKDIDKQDFYKDKYINLQTDDLNNFEVSLINNSFKVEDKTIERERLNYIYNLSKLFEG